MGLNKPFDRNFFLLGGAVKTSGGGMNLAKGQLAIVDLSEADVNGAKVLSSFLGKPKDKVDLAIRVGIPDQGVNKTRSNKPMSTAPFALNMIKSLKVSPPKQIVQEVDDLIVGYDGIDATKSFAFKVGDAPLQLTLKITEGGLAFRGGKGTEEVLTFDFEIPKCDPLDSCEDCDTCDSVDCKGIIEEMVARIKRRQLVGGRTVADYVDVTPVIGGCTTTDRTLIPYVYYTLSVCDTGDESALAMIQAQYEYPVIRTNRQGSNSTYQILVPDSAGAPADYDQTIASLIKGCEDCPDGYTEVEGGYVYAITIEDDGVALTTQITNNLASAKYVANTLRRATGNNAGVGFYTAVYTSPITGAEIASFTSVSTNARNTATVQLVGTAQSICEDDTVTSTAWVEGDTCNAVQDRYSIVLPDDGCENDRLAELQTAYPNLTVYAFHGTRALTLTGTSGTANININGTDYLATFNTDLTTTADDFRVAHAAAILADTGLVVTDNAGVLTFAGESYFFNSLSITNATGNLAGTLATAVSVFDGAACSNKYETVVTSNLVCEECDPIFLDFYTTQAPGKYADTQWAKETTVTTTGNCLCGIRFRGKTFKLSGDEALRDTVGFTETSTRIEVSAGYPTEIREGIGRIPEGTAAVTRRGTQKDRDNLGGNLYRMEEESYAYFLQQPYRHNYLSRVFLGETSVITDPFAQYIDYALEIQDTAYSSSFGQREANNIVYHFFVEVGRHEALEALLNNLAANAGVPGVQALA